MLCGLWLLFSISLDWVVFLVAYLFVFYFVCGCVYVDVLTVGVHSFVYLC